MSNHNQRNCTSDAGQPPARLSTNANTLWNNEKALSKVCAVLLANKSYIWTQAALDAGEYYGNGGDSLFYGKPPSSIQYLRAH